MNSGESSQSEEESLFLRRSEVMLCDALIIKSHLSWGKRKTNGMDQNETDVVQYVDAQLGVPTFQVGDECPALFVHQDLNQGSNGPAFVVACVGDVFP